jgi:hypothetical protein
MQVMFNSQERTLREIVALAASSGWKVVKVTKTATSLFGHIVAVPTDILIQKRAKAGSGSAFFNAGIVDAKTRIPQKLNESISKATIDEREEKRYRDDMQTIERASSRCGTPTFGSRMELSSFDETLAKFGGGVLPSKGLRGPSASSFANRSALKPAAFVTLKKPSPLSLPLLRRSPPLHSPTGKLGSPRHDQSQSQSPAGPTLIQRRLSLAQLRPQSQQGPQSLSQPPLSATRHLLPLSPMSPRQSTHFPLPRHPSHAQLSQVGHTHSQSQSQAPSVLPSLIPVRSEPVTPVSRQEHHQRHATPIIASSRRDSPRPILTRRSSSYVQLSEVPSRKRSGTIILPLIQTSNMNAEFGTEMPGNNGLIMGVSSGVGALGGAVLQFEIEQERGEGSARPQSPAVVGVSVLAAAAQIERRDFSQPPSL